MPPRRINLNPKFLPLQSEVYVYDFIYYVLYV